MIAKNCAHDGITPDEILRDRLVLGLRDDKVRERLLRINDLSLLKAVDICKAAEQTSQQIKMMNSGLEDSLRHVRRHQRNYRTTEQKKKISQPSAKTRGPVQNWPECKNCGRHHASRQCPAYGQTCRGCGKKNHFQSKCRAATAQVSSIQVPINDNNVSIPYQTNVDCATGSWDCARAFHLSSPKK